MLPWVESDTRVSKSRLANNPIEEKIAQHLPGAQQVVVVGNGRGYLCALIAGTVEGSAVQTALDAVNPALPHYRQIRNFAVISTALTPENGLLTANGAKIFFGLVFVAIACILMGTGIPTTPTYIILASIAGVVAWPKASGDVAKLIVAAWVVTGLGVLVLVVIFGQLVTWAFPRLGTGHSRLSLITADRLRGQALDKKSVQGSETPVQGLRGLEEEAAAGGIVHDGLRGEGEFWVAGKAVG